MDEGHFCVLPFAPLPAWPPLASCLAAHSVPAFHCNAASMEAQSHSLRDAACHQKAPMPSCPCLPPLPSPHAPAAAAAAVGAPRPGGASLHPPVPHCQSSPAGPTLAVPGTAPGPAAAAAAPASKPARSGAARRRQLRGSRASKGKVNGVVHHQAGRTPGQHGCIVRRRRGIRSTACEQASVAQATHVRERRLGA